MSSTSQTSEVKRLSAVIALLIAVGGVPVTVGMWIREVIEANSEERVSREHETQLRLVGLAQQIESNSQLLERVIFRSELSAWSMLLEARNENLDVPSFPADSGR